ncbi:E3 ubiquitin-protein ligase MGRN1-like isoform X4 [Artemia franciscana]|uniref:E3 ubiquitin-protein ligase MGRN1-like isoform X4 n=1 Tax=Artemia franciscana TaxID=6661 RepID=UPI0032DBA5A3
MGSATSIFRNEENSRAPRTESVSSNFIKCPVKSGNFFSDYFILGGERFDSHQQESYLFGDNGDLNFIGGKAVPFPYPSVQSGEPTKCLKALVHIRRESVRLVKADVGAVGAQFSDLKADEPVYNFEFVFDSDVKCSAKIQILCVEDATPTGVIYSSRDRTIDGPMIHFPAGPGQIYSQPMHLFFPSRFSTSDLQYSPENGVIPVAVQLIAEEGDEPRQSTTTYVVVEKHFDGSYFLRPLKQKLFVDGLCYLLQEIYGIENKNIATAGPASMEDVEDNSSECVICMSEERDTLILPCRHLCLCSTCADSLRYQASNCPICRSPFRALLQLRALQKVSGYTPLNVDGTSEGIPYGYEPISLIEALNGPAQAVPMAASSPKVQREDGQNNDFTSDFVSIERIEQALSVLGYSPWDKTPDNSQKESDVSANDSKGSEQSTDDSTQIMVDIAPQRVSTIEEEKEDWGEGGISGRLSQFRHTVSHGSERKVSPNLSDFKRSGSIDHVHLRKLKLEASPGLSLPGTPMSGFSCKSSGDSFVSASSTKGLLVKTPDLRNPEDSV